MQGEKTHQRGPWDLKWTVELSVELLDCLSPQDIVGFGLLLLSASYFNVPVTVEH